MSAAGLNARIRSWWLAEVADPRELPPELVAKIRLLEGSLPILGRFLGLGGMRSLVDALPDEDELTAVTLRALHGWTGRMLDGLDLPVIDVEPEQEDEP